MCNTLYVEHIIGQRKDNEKWILDTMHKIGVHQTKKDGYTLKALEPGKPRVAISRKQLELSLYLRGPWRDEVSLDFIRHVLDLYELEGRV